MNWNTATDIILIASLAVLAVFAVMGFCQLVKRKSFFKVDKPLIGMFVPLLLILLTYYFFNEVVVINYSPIDPTKPSFPSSHVMATTTIFACVAIILPRYLQSKAACIVLDIIMLTLTVLMSIGRVLANEHWLMDVIAALIFSMVYTGIYYFIIRRKKDA